MAPREFLVRAEPGFSLPAFDRLAPPPPPDVLAARIEAHTGPGDVVVDLHGRGGWVARAAVDRQRRAVSIESSPLTRLLAEVVLRPPDIRHLDAAFQALAAAPRRESSLKLSVGELFATRCPTCGRSLVADEFVWENPEDPDAAEARARLIRRSFRCAVCRDQVGGGEQRHAPPDEQDLVRAAADPADSDRRALRDRFPIVEGGEGLVDQLLALHTPRQLVGLHAILERIDADLRAAPVEAALRLSLLHALLPASRLNGYPGRVATLRVANGRVKLPAGGQWRERNPWLAFEDGYRIVRGFIARLEGAALGPVPARFGEDVRALVEGSATVSVRVGTASAFRALGGEGAEAARTGARDRVRLVVGQPPLRPNPDRLAFAYYATAWLLGREAAALLPLEPMFGPTGRVPWGWQAGALRRTLEAADPLLARDARVVLIAEAGGPEAVVAAVVGGVAAGFRLAAVRLAEPGEENGGIVELTPPGGPVAPRALTRANVALPPVPGGAGDPETVVGRGIFAPPERYEARPFSPSEAARAVSDTAVEVLKVRGEPARFERLLGEILVGLDRAGHLRRLVTAPRPGEEGGAEEGGPKGRAGSGLRWLARPTWERPAPERSRGSGKDGSASAGPPATGLPSGLRSTGPAIAGGDIGRLRRVREPEEATDPVERLLGLVRDELGRPDHRRLTEIEPGRWWLAGRDDRDAAAVPLADRVEWSVFSLLSTAGPLSEAAFYERIAGLFSGPDLPDETLVRACLESYRSRASTADRLLTGDDLLRRSVEHGELLALLADVGHGIGFSVWLGLRQQERRVGGRPLGDRLSERERRAFLPLVSRAPAEVLEEVDCIWYVRGKATVLWEVEWTAMLSEPLLRRHARIPTDERTVRFLVVAPERVELVRHKLDRSPLLRAALEEGNWHILKANHLRTFASLESPALADLEPFLGLDPRVERASEQLSLFLR